MEYSLTEEKIYKGFKQTIISFDENSIRIVYTTDYYDTDGYWEEYYSLDENALIKVLDRCGRAYELFELFLLQDLDPETVRTYNSIESENCKLVFLYIMIIKIKHPKIHGGDLIYFLCGKEIKYEFHIYSKGP
jgi:hypothetical protein